MAWFQVEVTDERDFVSSFDPAPDKPAKWIIHPPEPYMAAKLVMQRAQNVIVDMTGVDPDSPDYTTEFIKRSTLKDSALPLDLQYEWVLLGLSKIKPYKGKAITEIDMDFLKLVPHDVIVELSNEISGLATVDAVTEKNSGSPSGSED